MTRQPRDLSIALGALLFASAIAGCGKSAGDDFAQFVERGPDDASYTLRYLSPPWRFGEQNGDFLRIDISRAGRELVNVDAGLDPFPKYRLIADVIAGTPMRNLEAIDVPSNRVDFLSARPFITYDNTEGFELGWREPETGFQRRFVMLAHPRGTLSIAVSGFPELFEPELSDMLRSIAVEKTVAP